MYRFHVSALLSWFFLTGRGPGTVSTLAGSTTGFPGLANGVGTLATFLRPKGVAVAGGQNSCLCDVLFVVVE
jgi:hypothetical protein